MSLEAALAELTTATRENTAILERVILGQEAAMAKLEGAPTTRKPRGAAAAPAVTTEPGKSPENAPAATEQQAADVAVVSEAVDIDAMQARLKEVAIGWRNTATDEATKEAQNQLLRAVQAKTGATKLTGPEAPTDPDVLAQAIFYISRAAAGHPVDLNADYDFNGLVDQGVSTAGAGAAVAEEEDPLG